MSWVSITTRFCCQRSQGIASPRHRREHERTGLGSPVLSWHTHVPMITSPATARTDRRSGRRRRELGAVLGCDPHDALDIRRTLHNRRIGQILRLLADLLEEALVKAARRLAV